MGKRAGAGAPFAPECYLSVETHSFASLPDQSTIPFWEQAWIAPELKELLFGQSADALGFRACMIVHASLRELRTKLFDLDSALVDVPIRCLFKGDAAEDLKEDAPYLLDLMLPDGACDDRNLVPAFHLDLLARHWGHECGIFIRTTAPMNEAWTHFHKFTKAVISADAR